MLMPDPVRKEHLQFCDADHTGCDVLKVKIVRGEFKARGCSIQSNIYSGIDVQDKCLFTCHDTNDSVLEGKGGARCSPKSAAVERGPSCRTSKSPSNLEANQRHKRKPP
jgi:hypothetical protein